MLLCFASRGSCELCRDSQAAVETVETVPQPLPYLPLAPPPPQSQRGKPLLSLSGLLPSPGRLSFEESRELLRRTNTTASGNSGNDTDNDADESAAPFSNGTPRPSPSPSPSRSPASTAAAAAAQAPPTAPPVPPPALSDAGRGCPSGGSRVGTAGLALSMEARHALLSATYEHVLGDGLRALVRDVERAVSRCTCRYVVLLSRYIGGVSRVVFFQRFVCKPLRDEEGLWCVLRLPAASVSRWLFL